MSDIKTGDDVVYQDDNGQSRLARGRRRGG